MPTTLSTSGIFGTDNETPQYDPTASFKIWSITEIYLGAEGANKHVPKIDDLVVVFPPLVFKRVVSIDETTMVAEMVGVDLSEQSGEFTEEDLLLGVGPGTQADTYRIYIDKSVLPHSLTVDPFVTVGGSRVTHARIFRGSDLNGAGDIVSLIYDSLGGVVGNLIPLEVISTNGNVSTKVIPPCQTMADIQNNEILTAVLYTDTGHVASKRQFLAENTAYILRANTFARYVTHISLKCPFLSSNDPTLINLPVNVTLTGLNAVGVVHYSDGSSIEYPVDGTRFAILGLNNFIATQVGQEIPLVLRLKLNSDEVSYDTSEVNNGYMTRSFRIMTTASDGAYNVKLYCVPTWQNAVNGYRLRWFMYNLDRQTTEEVTNHVTFTPDSVSFNPTSYGIAQNLVVAVNLNDVNPTSVSYRHVQSLVIVLRGPGTQRTTNWTITYVNGQDPLYGVDTHANLKMINSNLYRIKVDSGFANQTEWLNKLYYAGKPLFDPLREGAPPIPNFFQIVVGGTEVEYNLDEWNIESDLPNGLDVNGTVIIRFIRRTQTTDLQVGLAALPIYELP